ncbi:hypothetical protein EMCG_03374 [[Emmonsia] crescens]|uniref:Uncharacterized protein n=1 Tax=[Emmonsia] crescens TaxID=73230 RepID=A0A0G2HWG8_9EURO|nr:hypothetical protein EMCG_03374 [Emmonsia crescens UAMH 3008]
MTDAEINNQIKSSLLNSENDDFINESTSEVNNLLNYIDSDEVILSDTESVKNMKIDKFISLEMSNMIKQHDIKINSSEQNKISVEKIQKHAIISEYLHTVSEEILHFIYTTNSLNYIQDDYEAQTSSRITSVFTELVLSIQFSLCHQDELKLVRVNLLSKDLRDDTDHA